MAERPQRGQQVATIHRGHEDWGERLQGARVVPVHKVASMPTQLTHRSKRLQGFLREFRNSQVSKLAGHLAGIEQQAKIRWGQAGSEIWGVFLNIVGDEPVVLSGAELLEVAPGTQSSLSQK